jgi:hypothetical protein
MNDPAQTFAIIATVAVALYLVAELVIAKLTRES